MDPTRAMMDRVIASGMTQGLRTLMYSGAEGGWEGVVGTEGERVGGDGPRGGWESRMLVAFKLAPSTAEDKSMSFVRGVSREGKKS